MRLTAQQKTAGMLATLLAINDKSFEVNERASALKFEALFTAGDVFVDDMFQTRAFAIVTDRDGPYLVVIAVTSGLQRCGIGTKLLREIEDFYTLGSECEIKLTCKIENWQAQRPRCGRSMKRTGFGARGSATSITLMPSANMCPT